MNTIIFHTWNVRKLQERFDVYITFDRKFLISLYLKYLSTCLMVVEVIRRICVDLFRFTNVVKKYEHFITIQTPCIKEVYDRIPQLE